MRDAMQFRDYIFTTNPQSITVTKAAALATHLCPGQGSVVQNLGPQSRVIRCQGSFWGGSCDEALAQLEGFQSAAEGDGAGMLFLPGLEPFPARLRELVFEAVGDGRIIPYTMTFLEEGGTL